MLSKDYEFITDQKEILEKDFQKVLINYQSQIDKINKQLDDLSFQLDTYNKMIKDIIQIDNKKGTIEGRLSKLRYLNEVSNLQYSSYTSLIQEKRYILDKISETKKYIFNKALDIKKYSLIEDVDVKKEFEKKFEEFVRTNVDDYLRKNQGDKEIIMRFMDYLSENL